MEGAAREIVELVDTFDLRVPMNALRAELLGVDGKAQRGQLFLPSQAARHAGPMRLLERLNDNAAFLPFVPDGEAQSILVNKERLVAVTLAAADNADPEAEDGVDVELPTRRIVVACGARSFEGEIALDMPQNQGRVLDVLNGPEDFVTLRDGDRHHLVRKSQIDRVVELRPAPTP